MSDDSIELLRQIRDNQREAIALQREHMAMYARQLDRVERINDRAEAMQVRGTRAMKVIAWVVLPLIILGIASIMWPYFARWFA